MCSLIRDAVNSMRTPGEPDPGLDIAQALAIAVSEDGIGIKAFPVIPD